MEITSSGIDAQGKLLPKYTVDGDKCNPPLTFSQVPTQAASLVLILDDPDAPNGTFTHWILYDMSPATLQILENALPMTGKVGTNSGGNADYYPPAPPSGVHRYTFTLFALDSLLHLPAAASKQDVLAAMKGHVLDQAELIGTYTRG